MAVRKGATKTKRCGTVLPAKPTEGGREEEQWLQEHLTAMPLPGQQLLNCRADDGECLAGAAGSCREWHKYGGAQNK